MKRKIETKKAKLLESTLKKQNKTKDPKRTQSLNNFVSHYL